MTGSTSAPNVGELGLAERQTLEICKALIRKPRVLVLDEPTSALLPEQVEWLFAKVRAFAAGRRDRRLHLAPPGGDREPERPGDRLSRRRRRRHRGDRRDARGPPRRVDARAADRALLPGAGRERRAGRRRVPRSSISPAPPRLRNVSMEIRRGEIVGHRRAPGPGAAPALPLALRRPASRRATSSWAARRFGCASRPTR